ncbi:hypothetical protein GCM10010191_71310 [Actinomadura vinacea]|uniref:Aldehyde dehydrogenase domain-containing protein n=1 Tax=Actinomadura vinacea TaxID=115336 RepID=A0ABP5X704_9ACTN
MTPAETRTLPAVIDVVGASVGDGAYQELRAEDIARLPAAETGNALRTQSRPETASAADVLRYYGGAAAEQKGESLPLGPGLLSYSVREPLGVVASIIPWNSPLVLAAKAKLPILEVLANEKRKTLIMVLFQTVADVGYSMVTVFSLTCVTEHLDLPRSWAFNGLLIAAAVDLVMQPLSGILSDRIGRRKVYAIGTVFLGLYAYPFFALLDHGTKTSVWLAPVLGLGIGQGGWWRPIATRRRRGFLGLR